MTKRATWLGRRTREETEKWNQTKNKRQKSGIKRQPWDSRQGEDIRHLQPPPTPHPTHKENCTHLQYCEVFQHTVHHVFLRQVFQFVDKVDHVFTHGRSVDAVHETTILKPRVLCLQSQKSSLALQSIQLQKEDTSPNHPSKTKNKKHTHHFDWWLQSDMKINNCT